MSHLIHRAVAVLLLTAIALLLFTRERIPLESSSLFVLAGGQSGH